MVRSSVKVSYSTFYVRFEEWKDVDNRMGHVRKQRALPLLATFFGTEVVEAFGLSLRISFHLTSIELVQNST